MLHFNSERQEEGKFEMKKDFKIKKIMLATLWVALGGASIFLLVAAIKSKEAKSCKGIEINIHGGIGNNFFVDKKEIMEALKVSENANPVAKPIGSFNLKKLEQQLMQDIWIKTAELYFDNNEVLQVTINEREPVARVFTNTGASFYIDDSLTMLPLSKKYSARLPVFTGFPTNRKVLSKADSSLLQDIKVISLAIQKDSFCMAMIDQVDINENNVFEMVPKIGNQLIVFGDAQHVEAKLDKMKIFYKQVMVKTGWNYYSVIDVSYNNQVLARRKGAADVSTDSLRALQLMKLIAERAEQAAGDSARNITPDNGRNVADSSMIQQSIQRDDDAGDGDAGDETGAAGETETKPATKSQPVTVTQPVVIKKPVAPKPPVKTTTAKKTNKPVAKPVQKKLPVKNEKRQPKILMPKKNDYNPSP